jgi:hypothetical protein
MPQSRPPTTLRDILTGAVQGNTMNNIPLGFADDPRFNNFAYNIFGSLGPSASDGVTSPNEGTVLSDWQTGTFTAGPGRYNDIQPGQSPSTGRGGGGMSFGAASPSQYVSGPLGTSGGFPWQQNINSGPSYMGGTKSGSINTNPSFMGGGTTQNLGWPYMPTSTASGGGNMLMPGGLRSSMVRPPKAFSFFG